MNRHLTLDQLAACYGICSATLRAWRKRTGLAVKDLHNPSKLAARLMATAINHSPRLARLCDSEVQNLITQKIAIFIHTATH